MNVDEVILPPPHARVLAHRNRVGQESQNSPSSSTVDFAVGSPPDFSQRSAYASYTIPPAWLDPLPSLPEDQNDRLGDDNDVRIVLALDYGTTYTGVAYAKSGIQTIDLEDIHSVQNWPGATEVKVPSLISYSKSKMRLAQYGYSIDDESDVLSKTKLELEDNRHRGNELTSFSQTLHGLVSQRLNTANAIAGLIPRHLAMDSEDIVQEYLERIAGVTHEDVVVTLGPAVPEQIPFDMIITHPATWSTSAMNKTYRAAMAAFSDRFPTIRNVSFVSEPEACAHYTMRAAQKIDHGRFRKGDCFIVVDAGGGTIDLASFLVTGIDTVRNRFTMEPAGYNAGYECGSTFVDAGFIKVLKERLGPEDSKKIVDSGPYGNGGHFVWTKEGMQVFKAFLPIKHSFTGDDTNLVEAIPLPRNLGIQDHAGRGIHDGNLELTANDIREMFSFSIKEAFGLIAGQIDYLHTSHPRRKVKSIFLSGGFAKSEYLFSRISQFAGEQNISVEKGHDCWCAVSKGAVMKGLGLLTGTPPAILRSPCSYGVKTRRRVPRWRNTSENFEVDELGNCWDTDRIKWTVKKNDAIMPNKDHVTTYDFYWTVESKVFDPSSMSARKLGNPSYRKGPAFHEREILFLVSNEDESTDRYSQLNKSNILVTTLYCDLRLIPQSSRQKDPDNDKAVLCPVKVEVRVSTTEMAVIAKSGEVIVGGPKTLPSRPPAFGYPVPS